jgi:tRNA(Ile2) C34 agmatinyltransferase TiaS
VSEFQTEPKCPECGIVPKAFWQCFEVEDGQKMMFRCRMCKTDFEVTQWIDVRYTVKRKGDA